MELTKPEKRHARALIDQSLEKEFVIGLKQFNGILQEWKDGKNVRESYYAIFTAVKNFDKHIASRYDDQSNSTLIFVIIALFREKLISEEDLNGFEETTVQRIKRWVEED